MVDRVDDDGSDALVPPRMTAGAIAVLSAPLVGAEIGVGVAIWGATMLAAMWTRPLRPKREWAGDRLANGFHSLAGTVVLVGVVVVISMLFLLRFVLDNRRDIIDQHLGRFAPGARIRDFHGRVLFDIGLGHDDPRVEDAIDEVNTEYLDLLLDLTGDDYMDSKSIDWTDAEPA